MPRTAPAKVNKALKAAGLEVEIVRGNGYYYFVGLPGTPYAGDEIRSIYANSLLGYSTEEVVRHVRDELARINAKCWNF